MLAINAGWRGENTDDLKFLNAMVGPSSFFAYIIIIWKLQGQGPIIIIVRIIANNYVKKSSYREIYSF